MRVYIASLGVWFLSLACATTPRADAEKVNKEVALSQATDATAPSCADESFCTREYMPKICQFSGQNFEASNLCEAKKLAKRYACEKRLTYVDSLVQCQTKNAAKPIVSGAPKECKHRTFCTKELNPQRCAYQGEEFRGGNRCEAMQKVRLFACEHGLSLDEKSVSCQAAQGQQEKSR